MEEGQREQNLFLWRFCVLIQNAKSPSDSEPELTFGHPYLQGGGWKGECSDLGPLYGRDRKKRSELEKASGNPPTVSATPFYRCENWDSERLSDLLKITKEVSGGAESQSPGSWDAKVLSPPPFGLPNHQWSCQSWYEDSLLYGGICELAGMWSVTAFWFKTQWWERTVLQTDSENRIWTKPLSLEESGSNQTMWKERWAWETLSYYSLMISPKQSWRQLTMDFRIIHLERDNTYCTKVYFHFKCKLPCYIGFWFIIIFISHTECFIKVPAEKN